MATGKTSFVLYCDLNHTVGHLTDEQAGRLFKHILQYVNDENPITDDAITNISFEPIKQQLKRDLKKWKGEKKKKSLAGKKGMANRWRDKGLGDNKSITGDNSVIPEITEITVSESVSVNDNVTVINKREREDTARTVVNAEIEILKNPIQFEVIVMNARREISQGREILHRYHLYLESKEMYPKTKKAVFAGFEKWINDEKKFERNGTYQQLNTSSNGKRVNRKDESAHELIGDVKAQLAALARTGNNQT